MMKKVIYVFFLLASFSIHAETYEEAVAVFVSPTNTEIKAAKKSLSDEQYAVWLDHGTYYSYQIDKYLTKLGVKTASSDDMEFVFISCTTQYELSLTNREYQWSVIMFNGREMPRLYEFPFDPGAEKYFSRISNN